MYKKRLQCEVFFLQTNFHFGPKSFSRKGFIFTNIYHVMVTRTASETKRILISSTTGEISSPANSYPTAIPYHIADKM